MTTVVIRGTKAQKYTGFTCMGHADYARPGKPDILCASISILVINTVNSLEELAGEALRISTNEETGFIRCEMESDLQEKSVFLMDAMVFGLQQLANTYGEKYLTVKFEEV
ncbi:hypothetical protein IMSAGC003_02308 [Lachnospiraceae bacterium]|jgi:uncharacterized protein YsxB (DUF464 family)|nr:ribosomal-processing cysteine protease Prp [Lachnospiraceae bacterium]MCX4271087.1 ribosomal-processing cysteine protease Prp [Acetatifactor sp.]GFH95757.1 hypothetical protein IMSAGC003_02308 [Lachnospiraceae bacterium]